MRASNPHRLPDRHRHPHPSRLPARRTRSSFSVALACGAFVALGGWALLSPAPAWGQVGAGTGGQATSAGEFSDPSPSDLRAFVERYSEDRSALLRRHSVGSPNRRARMGAFYREWADRLDGLDYEGLNLEGKIDWQLLRNRVRYEEERLGVEAELEAELEPFLPFQTSIVLLHEMRRELEGVHGQSAAGVLDRVADEVDRVRGEVEAILGGDRVLEGVELTPVIAMRAVARLDELTQATSAWFDHFDGSGYPLRSPRYYRLWSPPRTRW